MDGDGDDDNVVEMLVGLPKFDSFPLRIFQ